MLSLLRYLKQIIESRAISLGIFFHLEYFIRQVSYISFEDIYVLCRRIDKKKYILGRKNFLLYVYVYMQIHTETHTFTRTHVHTHMHTCTYTKKELLRQEIGIFQRILIHAVNAPYGRLRHALEPQRCKEQMFRWLIMCITI